MVDRVDAVAKVTGLDRANFLRMLTTRFLPEMEREAAKYRGRRP